jgi:hypothetical protein
MIKVKSFENHLSDDLDHEIEDYIADRGIKGGDIIQLTFYSEKGEDGLLYHFARLVYELSKNWKCVNCGEKLENVPNPCYMECRCGSESWKELN